MNGLVRFAPWVTLTGVFALLSGLIRDARMHRLDPGLAAREGVFTMANPAHRMLRTWPPSNIATCANSRWTSSPMKRNSIPPSNWEPGGQHDTNGFALAAHPGQSQGRPTTNASSQLIVRTGLPVLRAPECPSPGWSHHNVAAMFLRLPEGAPDIFIPDTNVIERSFLEERRRTKIIPRFFDERSCLKLVFATLRRSSQRWQRIRITELEQKQLLVLRQHLGLDPDPVPTRRSEEAA